MNNKLYLAFSAPLFILMAVFAILKGRGGNMLLALPASFNKGISIESIERFCEDKFLVTYEINFLNTVSTGYKSYELTFIATNSAWQSINAFPMVSGSFFTKSAYDAKALHGLLNVKAASIILGSSNIKGKVLNVQNKSFLITGVIDDGDDENGRIYIPSSTGAFLGLNSAFASELLVLLSQEGVDEVYAEHELKSLVQGEYIYINLQKAAFLYWERLFFAIQCAFCALLLRACCFFFSKLKKHSLHFKDWTYMPKLFVSDLLNLNLVTNFFLFTASIVLLTFIIMHLIFTGISWSNLNSLGYASFSNFSAKLKPLQYYETADLIVFYTSLAACAASVCIFIKTLLK